MQENINVLVVDDEQIILDSVNKHLRKDNYTVYTALSVEEALSKINEVSMHVILTDLMMPEIDGLEFMEIVKKDHPNIPMIMVTGYATINTAIQAKQLGAFDYIAKPFTRKELRSVIKRAAEISIAALEKEHAEIGAEGGKDKIENGGKTIKALGDHSWMMLQPDNTVLLGVNHSFLHTIGKIQSVHLPEEGDELRQGGVFLQIFSADLRSHTLLAPLSGVVVNVNRKVLTNPDSSLQDPYGEGWLIRLKPSKFEHEIKMLGL